MNDNYDERDDELLAMASQLSTEVAPQRDLWPGIEAAIAPPQRARWSPLFAQAAAVVLLVAGSSGVTYMAVTDKYESDRPVLTQPVLPNMLFEETSFGGKYTLGSGFQDARAVVGPEFIFPYDFAHPFGSLRFDAVFAILTVENK